MIADAVARGGMSPTLLAGFAKVDITPPLDIPYLSYYPRQTPFGGVHDRLFARALAVERLEGVEPAAPGRPEGPGVAPAATGAPTAAQGTRAAILAIDSLGISRGVLGPGRDVIADIRQRIASLTGIPAAAILIAASHAHSTPQTTDIAPLAVAAPGATAWLERLIDQLAGAVATAWAARRPARLHGATGLAPGIAWNRRILTRDGRLVRLPHRPPDDQVVKEPRDDRVPVLLVADATTPPGHSAHWRGAVIGFTCHPTTVQVQPLVSADYPGLACALVERELGAAACLFLQGACGDVGPVRATTDFQDVDVYGRALGGEALRQLALLEARDLPPMSAALAVAGETVVVDRRPIPDPIALAREAAALQVKIQEAPDEATRHQAIAAYRRVAEPLQLARLGEGPVHLEVQAIRLGEALIVACEGELFVELGRRIAGTSPAGVTFVTAYSNGYEGYLPTLAAWDEGGYEVSLGPWTRVDRTGGETVTERAIALARRVWAQSGSAPGTTHTGASERRS
jgi:neutral ceramidase